MALTQEQKASKVAPVSTRPSCRTRSTSPPARTWDNQCRHCHGAAAYPGKAPKLNPGQLAPDFIYERVTFGFGKMPAWKTCLQLSRGVVATLSGISRRTAIRRRVAQQDGESDHHPMPSRRPRPTTRPCAVPAVEK
jgi:cytochrome c5